MIEHKAFHFTEFKATDEKGNFQGVLSTYGNEDFVGDVCDPGCFDNSIRTRGSKLPFLWQHLSIEPIGSLIVTDTKDNLAVDGHFNMGVQRGREAFSLLKAGDVNGLSIGFQLIDADYIDGVRHLKEIDLIEGSFVTFPANPAAMAEAKMISKSSKAALRKQISAVGGFKLLDKTVQKKLMKAVDEALEEEEEKEEEENPDDQTDDPESDEVNKEIDEEEEEELKTLFLSINKLKDNVDVLTKSVKEVI
jgi:hypothetical protein